MRSVLKRLVLRLVMWGMGVPLIDRRTGQRVGKVAVLPWRGRLLVLGAGGEALRPQFLPQERETYWMQELGFVSHPPPDFRNVRNESSSGADDASEPEGG